MSSDEKIARAVTPSSRPVFTSAAGGVFSTARLSSSCMRSADRATSSAGYEITPRRALPIVGSSGVKALLLVVEVDDRLDLVLVVDQADVASDRDIAVFAAEISIRGARLDRSNSQTRLPRYQKPPPPRSRMTKTTMMMVPMFMPFSSGRLYARLSNPGNNDGRASDPRPIVCFDGIEAVERSDSAAAASPPRDGSGQSLLAG